MRTTARTRPSRIADGGAVYFISRASQPEATVVSFDTCSFNENRVPAGKDLFNLDDCKVTVTQLSDLTVK